MHMTTFVAYFVEHLTGHCKDNNTTQQNTTQQKFKDRATLVRFEPTTTHSRLSALPLTAATEAAQLLEFKSPIQNTTY